MHQEDGSGSCGCGCGCGCDLPAPASDQNLPDWRALPDSETVCFCHGVTKGEVRRAVEMGAYTLPLIKAATNAGRCKPGCGDNPRGRCCAPDLMELIRLYHQGPPEWATRGPCCG